jgi:hypothetical protein
MAQRESSLPRSKLQTQNLGPVFYFVILPQLSFIVEACGLGEGSSGHSSSTPASFWSSLLGVAWNFLG